MKIILLYVLSLIIFFVIDFIWLTKIAKDLYQEQIGFLLRDNFQFYPALLFYLLYIVGIVYFAILPAIETNNWSLALFNGCFLGFLCYATYDLTNLATIKNWPVKIVILDILWGTFITGITAFLTFMIYSKNKIF